jgi:hypothetical protein
MLLRIAIVVFFLFAGIMSALSVAQDVSAKDFSPYFKGETITNIEVKKAEDAKIDTATVKTKSGKCYQFQLQKGKVIGWKTCQETTWFMAE